MPARTILERAHDPDRRRDAGQSAVLLLGALCGLLLGGFVLGAVARGIAVRSDDQKAADLAALAGARAMLDAYPRLFEPGPGHLDKPAYEALARAAAQRVAQRNGVPAEATDVTLPDGD